MKLPCDFLIKEIEIEITLTKKALFAPTHGRLFLPVPRQFLGAAPNFQNNHLPFL